MRNKFSIKRILLFSMIFMLSCNKQDNWLDVKRLKSDVTPTTLTDFQALLDDNITLNMKFSNVGIFGTDNLIISDANYLSITEPEQNLYSFNKDIWINSNSRDWSRLYTIIEYANVVLDGLVKLNQNGSEANDLKGQALFFRAFANYTLAQLFCLPYSKQRSKEDLGIPLRLTSDVNVLYPRGSVEQVYKQILSDAKQAVGLLNIKQINNYRPNKIAALGLLAKTYFVMNDYKNAGNFTDQAISKGVTIIDFNDPDIVSPTATYPFPSMGIDNPAIVFNASSGNYGALGAGLRRKEYIDTLLYEQYEDNDLRKSIFYKVVNGNVVFNGSYSGRTEIFTGIATNELYLIRAECYAREGKKDEAMSDLNTLLIKRYISGTFIPKSVPNADSSLSLVLKERRKELPSTGNIRWEDLRRLNIDPKYQVTVVHKVNGQTYTLPPNNHKYVLPIPDDEIQISGIEQNLR